jgi:histidyl-tRNA synthetase
LSLPPNEVFRDVAIAGEAEMATGTLNVKNQSNGEQQSLDIASLTALFQ